MSLREKIEKTLLEKGFKSEFGTNSQIFLDVINDLIRTEYVEKSVHDSQLKECETKLKEYEEEVNIYKKVVKCVVNHDKDKFSPEQLKKLNLVFKKPDLLDKINSKHFELSDGRIIFWDEDKDKELEQKVSWLEILSKLNYREDVEKLSDLILAKFSNNTYSNEDKLIVVSIVKLREIKIFSNLVTKLENFKQDTKNMVICLVAYFGTLQQLKMLISDDDYGKKGKPTFNISLNIKKFFVPLNYGDIKDYYVSFLSWALYANNLEIIKWICEKESQSNPWYEIKNYGPTLPIGYVMSNECEEYLKNAGALGQCILSHLGKRNEKEKEKEKINLQEIIDQPTIISEMSQENLKTLMDKLL